MSEYAISIEQLSKRFRIGTAADKQRVKNPLLRAVTSPFRYLASNFREPSPDEIIWALRDISFDVQRGEALGIIGKNGAGKSTLLKILSQIIEPTDGRALVYGRVGSLLEVGTGFHPELTGRENIYLNGTILGMKKTEIDRRFDEIIAFAGIEKFLDTPVKRYSSGMYVRLAFAVAAHLQSEILLMDEVLAVGDAAFQKKCLGKMNDVAGEGRTILFVSHNMAAVTQLCRRAIWLENGKIKMIGNSGNVVQNYLSTNSQKLSEKVWHYPGDAPGDEIVRLLACRVLQDGEVASVVDINKSCQVEMEFQVLQQANNLISGVNLYNMEGLCLFDSCDWRPNNLAPGIYRKQLEIPAQMLAEGPFSLLVQLHFYDPDIKSVVLHDALQFEGIDSDHPFAVRGLYKGQWPGVMRIRLPWTDAEKCS